MDGEQTQSEEANDIDSAKLPSEPFDVEKVRIGPKVLANILNHIHMHKIYLRYCEHAIIVAIYKD